MRKVVLFLLLFCIVFGIRSQDKTILITESNLPYTSQYWFYSGYNNELQEREIKKHWDEGRHITSVAYTSNGWFVTMAKNTGFGSQYYHYGSDWPNDWIAEKWNNNYHITAIARSQSKWLVVMSQGSGYKGQYWRRDNWSELDKWYHEKRNEGYYKTSMAYNGSMWTLVVSQTDKISSQGYFWANSNDELNSKIKTEIWNRSYNIHAIGSNGSVYLVAYGNYSRNNVRGQNYNVNPLDVSGYIDKRWAENHQIAYIGGGYNGSNYVNNNDVRYNVNTSGLLVDKTWVDPSLTGPIINSSGGSTGGAIDNYQYRNPGTKTKCPICNGTGRCDRCGGDGNRIIDLGIRGNRINECGSCRGSGRCHQCHGRGYIR